ncbi:MAG: hypothetical protein RDU20_04470 [Desulfomonilaceae bacterium]|nr:hypothetical protein [Desulfomonilaceae bacterium]
MNWLAHTKLHVLKLHELDFDDVTYYMPNYRDSTALRESIKQVGILNRPVVQERPCGGMIPVLGRRRLQEAATLGVHESDVLVVSSDMPVSDGFLIAFFDNAGHRTFDSPTTAVVVKRLLDLFPREMVARSFLPILGVPPRGPRLERLRLLGTLEHRALKWLAEGRILEKTAVVLARLDPGDRAPLLDFLEKLGMNANKNEEVTANLYDLSVYQARPPADIIRDDAVRELTADDDIPAPERAARFRDLIRSWKFPELVDKEREFREWCTGLPAVPNVKVWPARSFENDEFTIEIRVSHRASVERVLENLKDMK